MLSDFFRANSYSLNIRSKIWRWFLIIFRELGLTKIGKVGAKYPSQNIGMDT